MINYLKDNKIKAMVDLLNEIKYGPYPTAMLHLILRKLENKGIPFLLDELPEGESYQYYCQKLDEYLISVIKNNK